MLETKGGIKIKEIQIGDIHYEFEYGCCIKSKVISKPELIDGCWEWKNEMLSTGKIINYSINPDYSHYGPNLYDYEAYKVNTKL